MRMFYGARPGEIKERADLVTERIHQITEETGLPGAYDAYMRETARTLTLLMSAARVNPAGDAEPDPAASTETDRTDPAKPYALQEDQFVQAAQRLYEKLAPRSYADSFLAPNHAFANLGSCGRLLSMLYADVMALIPWAVQGRWDLLTLWMELFVMIYGECRMYLAPDPDSGGREGLYDSIRDILYWFYHDNAEIMIWERISEWRAYSEGCLSDADTDNTATEGAVYVWPLLSMERGLFPSRLVSRSVAPQMDADHWEDCAVYLDMGYVGHCEEVIRYALKEQTYVRPDTPMDRSLFNIPDAGILQEGPPRPSRDAIRLTVRQKNMLRRFREYVEGLFQTGEV